MSFVSPEPKLPGAGSFSFYHLPRKTFTSWAWGQLFLQLLASCQILMQVLIPQINEERRGVWAYHRFLNCCWPSWPGKV